MRDCERCGTAFQERHSRHRFCTAACRVGGAAPVPVLGPVAGKLEVSIEQLALGREHDVLIESCRQLAATLDGATDCGECGNTAFDDKLWREWRLLLSKLIDVGGASGEGGDPIGDLIEGIRGAAVHDSKDGGA